MSAREHPIIFNAEMVRAILYGRKTQTRRIANVEFSEREGFIYVDKPRRKLACGIGVDPKETFRNLLNQYAPYGKVGDHLWVRETLACTAHHGVWYDADDDGFNNRIVDDRAIAIAERYGNTYNNTEQRRIPAIHMPRWASRILLEIVSVRLERINDISEQDAKAEGVEPNWIGPLDEGPNGAGTEGWLGDEYMHYMHSLDDAPAFSAKESFESLWKSIYGPGSWNENPLVWVIEFRKLDGAGK